MLLHQTTVKLKTYYAFMNNYATQSIKKSQITLGF